MGEDREIIQIHTDRLFLREMCEEDAESIVEMRGDEEVYRYFKEPHKITIGEHISWYRNSYLKNKNRIDLVAMLHKDVREEEDVLPAGNVKPVKKEHSRIIGVFGLQREEGADTAEVSYILKKDARRSGYASEAVMGIMKYAKEKWNCTRCEAIIHKENKGSVKFIEALGYELISTEGEFCRYGIRI